MKPVNELYTEEVYHELRPYHANWTPDQPVCLGDFGLLNQKRFIHQGNLGQFQVSFGVLKKAGMAQQHFCSQGAVEYSAKANAGSRPGGSSPNAQLDVRFTKSGAVFFNLAGCEYQSIKDKIALSRSIENLFRVGAWKLPWVVVTDLVTARSTTVAISNSAQAALTLAADAAVPNIDLADSSVELKAASSKGVGYQVVSAPGLSPLFALARLRKRWFNEPEFGPETRKFAEKFGEDPEFWLEDIE